MWCRRYEAVCRRHPDLVAVYQSGPGRLALLLRQTVVPLLEEQHRWLDETRRASRAVIAGFRAAGARSPIVVLQWRPLEEMGHVLGAWTLRYDADAARRSELAGVVARLLEDRRFLASLRSAGAPAGRPVAPGPARRATRRLSEWYRDMAACWLSAEPWARRQLILRMHRWVVERVLLPLSRGESPDLEDLLPESALAPDGPLGLALARSLPAADAGVWRPWIRLVVADLRSALAWPVEKRDGAWARWLFLIPYSIPVSRARAAALAVVGEAGGERGAAVAPRGSSRSGGTWAG